MGAALAVALTVFAAAADATTADTLRGGTGGIAKLASSGLLVGTLIPGALLVILGVVYLLQGNTSAAPMRALPSALCGLITSRPPLRSSRWPSR